MSLTSLKGYLGFSWVLVLQHRRPVVCKAFAHPKVVVFVSCVSDFDVGLLALNFRILSLQQVICSQLGSLCGDSTNCSHSPASAYILWPYGVHAILSRLNVIRSYVAISELQVQVYRHVGRSSLFLSGQGPAHLHMAPYPLCNCG